MWRVLLVLALISCKENESKLNAPPPPKAAPGDAAQKDLATQLEEIRAKLGLPALAAAAWRDGKLVEMASVGVRKVGDPTKVTDADEWHLGSNTKAMTALLVGMYVDRGALHWDDTLGKLFAGDTLDPAYGTVTLDQVLRHESGAPAEPPAALWKQLWDDGEKLDDTVARGKFVKATLAAPPAQKAGTFTYSNANYMIAGAALEKVTGKRWQDLIKSELFAKLDMKSCGFGAPGTKTLVDQPRGHDAGGTPIEPGPAADNPPGHGPAGTVHCLLADYGKFLNVFAMGNSGLVSAATLQHLTTASAQMAYAGGWMVVTNKRGKMLLHSGSNTMWYATAMVAPDEHLAFVVATNKGDQALEGSLGDLFGRYATVKARAKR
jgi:CubicO group peptidase (beta-lactamase class C family)